MVEDARQNSLIRHPVPGKKSISLTTNRTRTNITTLLQQVQTTVIDDEEIPGLTETIEIKKIDKYSILISYD